MSSNKPRSKLGIALETVVSRVVRLLPSSIKGEQNVEADSDERHTQDNAAAPADESSAPAATTDVEIIKPPKYEPKPRMGDRAPQRDVEQAKPRRGPMWLRVWLPLSISVFTVLILVVHAYFMYRQADMMEKQLRSMDKSLEISRDSANVSTQALVFGSRPYVGIVRPRIEVLEYGKPIVVEVTLVNSGNTPATEVVMNEVGANVGVDVRAMPYKLERLNQSGMMILPGRELIIKFSFDLGMTEAHFRDLKAGKLLFSAYGKGEYAGLGGRYDFDFCGLTPRRALKAGSLNLSECDNYTKR